MTLSNGPLPLILPSSLGIGRGVRCLSIAVHKKVELRITTVREYNEE